MHSSVTISKISDLKRYLEESHLEYPETEDIYSFYIDSNTIFIIDTRNSDKELYTRSDVSAAIDSDGILSVIIKDSDAVSEGDISGAYGVIIKSTNKVSDVIIYKEG